MDSNDDNDLREKLKSKRVRELKDMMKEKGISEAGCIEKNDLIDKLLKDESSEFTGFVRGKRKRLDNTHETERKKSRKSESLQHDQWCQALEEGDEKTISMLVEAGFPIDTRISVSMLDCTALILAAEKGNCGIAQLLCDKKADLEAKVDNFSDETALFRAANNFDNVTVDILLNARADPSTRIRYGETYYVSVLPEMVFRRLNLTDKDSQLMEMNSCELVIASLVLHGAEFHNSDLKHPQSPLEIMSRSSSTMLHKATSAHINRLEIIRDVIARCTCLIDAANRSIISYLDLTGIIADVVEKNKDKDKYDSIDLNDFDDSDDSIDLDENEDFGTVQPLDSDDDSIDLDDFDD
eukprot:CAMPEP_0185262146 /NCGR_PEP_ID=MMETSP1359-20130426/10366_1 /TAXON_ID=552665 /ORGANISM="Bigelowiella longifila, Strain CCMP242" /LENGTH=352 /DNA_ID=CAMNT_0027848993 /DNA_START=56 /DNA_END=1114 /DNA_ORIENTATION=+